MDTEEEYITLKQAARLGGYRTAGQLHSAIRRGRLKAIKPAGGVLLTTRAWLDEYKRGLWVRSEHPADGAGESGE